ncbi:uncharacterized protein BXZ73DRAFT_105187 [Epithele typhae]|uniref:uncharacterized protein n=1 Tax=Epithele typhae TaxID=378194 RepID=UPI00200867F1|nr:uncharacterized protein BXZ73DRAFT_105187 [Epithele typhae]KAH9918554.1 hypothetical protein BXZ73DRAFT_105187 [Epithele typhae]
MSQDSLCAIVTSRVCGCSGVLSSPALGEIFTAFRSSASVAQQHRRTCLFDRSTPRDEGPLGQSTAKSLPRAHGKTIVSYKDCAAEEVEASTRVAILAKDNTPVLLHCSSGVRRTSVFIAIDAVRGKMQKHKEAYVDDLVISQAASEIRATEPTAPVSVGDCEVGVPVAGFTSNFMDVDARSRPPPVASTPHTLPRSSDAVRSPTLQASPGPVGGRCPALPVGDQPHVFERWQQRRLRGSEQWEHANSRPAAKLARDERVGRPPELRHRKDGEVVRQRPAIDVDELRFPSLVDTARAVSERYGF